MNGRCIRESAERVILELVTGIVQEGEGGSFSIFLPLCIWLSLPFSRTWLRRRSIRPISLSLPQRCVVVHLSALSAALAPRTPPPPPTVHVRAHEKVCSLALPLSLSRSLSVLGNSRAI